MKKIYYVHARMYVWAVIGFIILIILMKFRL